MRFSYQWIKNYVDLEVSAAELAEDLSRFGYTLENMEERGDDYILDLEINPNRGDCLSMKGLAREIAAMYSLPLKNEKVTVTSEDVTKKIKVTVSDPKICPRYSARIIDQVEIKPSPRWLQQKLETYGFRSINNVVDVTNYVMIAIGQPLHAFDFRKIEDGRMDIHLSKEGEEIITLDGQNNRLGEGMIVIGDSQKIYDLAGIMGGFASEVDEKTTTIVLQGAIFDRNLIRAASKKLGKITDASYRYERGVDYEATIEGVDLAAKLIKETSPNAIIGPLLDEKFLPYSPRVIEAKVEDINNILGLKMKVEDIKKALERLEYRVELNNSLKVTIPSYRCYDVTSWQDLAEEIAKIYGYDNIPSVTLHQKDKAAKNALWLTRQMVKKRIKEEGFNEIYSSPFVSEKDLAINGFRSTECLEIANPLSADMQYLRPSLIPSILTAISKNPWAPEVHLFEIGKIFTPEEKWQGMLAVAGKSRKLSEICSTLRIKSEVKSIDQKILDYYKIRRPVSVILFDLAEIKEEAGKLPGKAPRYHYREISKFPPTVRDLAFIVSKEVAPDNMVKTIENISENILLVEVFDEFTSDKFGHDKKNVALHLWLQDISAPLSEEKANNIIEAVIKTIEDKYASKLRSK